MDELAEMLATQSLTVIEEAARECDVTIYELMAEIVSLRGNENVPAEQRPHYIMAWLLSRFETMSEYLDEKASEEALCCVCHGSGGIPEAPCYRCSGSGEALRRSA